MTADAKATSHDWTAPGVYPVAPGVHRVPLPLPTDGLRAVNVYVVEDGGGLVLIDSGWALEQARTALTAALAALGAGLGDVRSFLVTHVHRDHYTLAVQLRREFGSAVSLGLGEQQAIAALSGGTASPFAPQLAELRASGADELTRRLGEIARSLPGGTTDWEAPDRAVRLLNRFLSLAVVAVKDNGGVVDKFLGDGVMALFGISRARADHAERAHRTRG